MGEELRLHSQNRSKKAMSTSFPQPLQYTAKRCCHVLQGCSQLQQHQTEAQQLRITFPSLLERIQILLSHSLNHQEITSFRQWQLLFTSSLDIVETAIQDPLAIKKRKWGAQFDPSDRHLHRKGRTDFCSLNSFCILQEIHIPWLCMREILINPASPHSLLSCNPGFKSLLKW